MATKSLWLGMKHKTHTKNIAHIIYDNLKKEFVSKCNTDRKLFKIRGAQTPLNERNFGAPVIERASDVDLLSSSSPANHCGPGLRTSLHHIFQVWGEVFYFRRLRETHKHFNIYWFMRRLNCSHLCNVEDTVLTDHCTAMSPFYRIAIHCSLAKRYTKCTSHCQTT